MTPAKIEVLNAGGGGGDFAMRLLESGFNIQSLRTQATLRREEWLHYDTAITEVARERLVGISDLVAAGLTYNLPNALGKTSIEWEKSSDMDDALVSMDGVTQGRNDRMDFGIDSMPIPLVTKDFQLNIRALAASRTTGMPLDTMQAERATRKVVEGLESMLFSGSTILGSNAPIYGYTTATTRNTGSVTASWATTTGENILIDVLAMVAAANADHMYGPFKLYVPIAVHTHMSGDFKAASDKSILSRIMEVPSISGITATEQLSGTNIIMVQMTRDVVDLINGFQPTMVQWESQGGMIQHFKVMAIMPPRIKSDHSGQSGIVHYS